MIVYENGFLGLGSLSRIHGSSVYKVIIPALVSTLLLIGYHYFPFVLNSYNNNNDDSTDNNNNNDNNIQIIENPYTIGVLIAFYTFLLTFRLNFAYGRYWESATAIHIMLGKWLDCAMLLTSFHYQSKQYNYIIPPTFGSLQMMKNNDCDTNRIITANEILGRDRNYPGPVSYDLTYEVLQQIEIKELREQENALEKTKMRNLRSKSSSLFHRISDRIMMKRNKKSGGKAKKRISITSNAKSINNKRDSLFISNHSINLDDEDNNNPFEIDDDYDKSDNDIAIPIPVRFQQQFQLSETIYDDQYNNAGTSNHKNDHQHHHQQHQHDNSNNNHPKDHQHQQRVGTRKSFHHIRERMPPPSLFLQETAHLFSLLSAIALSTLRNHTIEDIVYCNDDNDKDQQTPFLLPINEYFPGQVWPPVDSDQLDYNVKVLYGEGSIYYSILYYVFGMNRSMKRQTLYNAARPLSVLGGISDNEIQLLQQARGPYSKVILISMWIQEFIVREHLNGSTGTISPPVISRLYQCISDGMNGYNQARKVAYVPFPFPNAQIASFFSLAIIFIFPILYDTYINLFWFAITMNFTTVLCFLGLHEVARELENPFRNVPNELPILTFQAQYNEALVTMYSGYHPDSWWSITPSVPKPKESEPTSTSPSLLPSPPPSPMQSKSSSSSSSSSKSSNASVSYSFVQI